jgi:hypothetical protein
MATIVLFVGLLLAGLALPYYMRKRDTNLRAPPPSAFRRWTPGQRAVFVWTAMGLTTLLLIPAAITGVMLLVGFGECIDVGNAGSWPRTTAGRAALAAIVVAVFLPAVLKWTEFLSRVRNYRDDEAEL